MLCIFFYVRISIRDVRYEIIWKPSCSHDMDVNLNFSFLFSLFIIFFLLLLLLFCILKTYLIIYYFIIYLSECVLY